MYLHCLHHRLLSQHVLLSFYCFCDYLIQKGLTGGFINDSSDPGLLTNCNSVLHSFEELRPYKKALRHATLEIERRELKLRGRF